jgi:pyruvate/2-oxoglutarate dehydrogenase complex dihydrolipoamide acyltransferase (E2) component
MAASAAESKVAAVGVDDAVEFSATARAFGAIAALVSAQPSVWRALAALLHLGEIPTDEHADACPVAKPSDEPLQSPESPAAQPAASAATKKAPVAAPASPAPPAKPPKVPAPSPAASKWEDKLTGDAVPWAEVVAMAVDDLGLTAAEASARGRDVLVGKLRRVGLEALGHADLRRRASDLSGSAFSDSKTKASPNPNPNPCRDPRRVLCMCGGLSRSRSRSSAVSTTVRRLR